MYFRDFPGDSVVKLNASTAGVMGSTCGWGTKIPQAVRYGKKKKKKMYFKICRSAQNVP